MTIDDVREARDELAAEGAYPSANAIVCWLQRNNIAGNKKMVLRYLHELGLPRKEPRMLSPVEMAATQLADAETTLDTSRSAMQEACLQLLLSQGYVYMGVRYGAWLPSDPAADGVARTAVHTQDAYRRAMADWERSRDQLAHVRLTTERRQQEAWTDLHHPELRQEREHWQHQAQHATSDRMHAEAKKNLQQAIFNHERAIANAPLGDE
jgi:hypothetical protein